MHDSGQLVLATAAFPIKPVDRAACPRLEDAFTVAVTEQ
jgi:hypothetical protein